LPVLIRFSAGDAEADAGSARIGAGTLDAMAERQSGGPTFAGWMGSMWLYTLLRFGMFFALWGILVLVGLRGFFAPVLALILSVPLSFVLLARPRAQFAQHLEARMQARHAHRADLDARLDTGTDDTTEGGTNTR
jgi:hypothetical protein